MCLYIDQVAQTFYPGAAFLLMALCGNCRYRCQLCVAGTALTNRQVASLSAKFSPVLLLITLVVVAVFHMAV